METKVRIERFLVRLSKDGTHFEAQSPKTLDRRPTAVELLMLRLVAGVLDVERNRWVPILISVDDGRIG